MDNRELLHTVLNPVEGIRIMMVGPSGVGKTTLAKYISEKYNLPFISGSYSDLIPETKDIPHSKMVENANLEQEKLLLGEREKAFDSNVNPNFVTDRSYLDDLAYLIVKLSRKVSKSEILKFENEVRRLLSKDCTHLIYFPFNSDMIDTWDIEDNNKRVLNPYFQYMVSLVMGGIINDLLCNQQKFLSDEWSNLMVSYPKEKLNNFSNIISTSIRMLTINTNEFDFRCTLADRLIEWEM